MSQLGLTIYGFLILMFFFSAWQCVHPLLLCLLLIGLSLLVSSRMHMSLGAWPAYGLILIFLGGMMVMFIYTTNLASNEKFFIQPKNPFLVFLLLVMALLTPEPISPISPVMASAPLLFYYPSMPVMWALLIYLLMVLFVSVKMTESFKGALIKSL